MKGNRHFVPFVRVLKMVKKTNFLLQDDGKMRLQLDEETIVWPGGLTQKPTGLMIPTHLKVLTILEKPFVYARQIERNQTCDPVLGETRCPLYNTKQSDNKGPLDKSSILIVQFQFIDWMGIEVRVKKE